jgi:hypothetical protein
MQKIQVYLVPNRIKVTTDVTGFATEFRQVYQRKLKLYKGIDNAIEFDVRDSDQRRQNIMNYSIIVKFFDADHKNLFSIQGTPVIGKPGLMTAIITADDLESIDPQILKMAAYLRSDTEERIIYSDSQFDIFADAEILDGYNNKLNPDDVIEEVTVFNYEQDSKEYISEIANFGTVINNDYSTSPTRSATFEFEGIYDGIIEIEATKDKSTAFGTTWETIGAWDTAVDQSKTFTGDYRFVRFRITRERSSGTGSGARFTVEKSGNVYTVVTVTLRGQNYLIGDELTIKGSQLGGLDSVNDLSILLTSVINGNNTQGNVGNFTWQGIASSGSAIFESVGTDPVNRAANPIDKIIIRN